MPGVAWHTRHGRWLSRTDATRQTAPVPPRRRSKSRPQEPQDPVAQFGKLLRESAEREQAERERLVREREEAEAAARAAAEHAAALQEARRDLDRAIEAVREARRTGKGVPEADRAWRDAKARVIELETGAPPEWAQRSAASE